MRQMYNTKTFIEIFDEYATFKYDYNDCKFPKMIDSDDTDNKISSLQTLYYLLYSKYGNSPIANWDEEQFKYKLFGIVFQYGPNWEKKLEIQKLLREFNLNDLIDEGQIQDVLDHEGTRNQTIQSSGTSGSTTTNTGTVGTANDVETITNHALNPETTPAVNAYSPLGYINEQTASKVDNDTTVTNNLTATVSGSNSNTTGVQNADTVDDVATKTIKAGKLKGYEKLLALLNSDITEQFLTKFGPLFQKAINIFPYLYESED